jgi:hypothetical protein
VQRLLGRFSAQGLIHHDPSRACLAVAPDALPRVALLGRLAIYGPGAARLHDEIVPITARWIEPTRRQGALRTYAREAETVTLTVLEAAFDEPTARNSAKQTAVKNGRSTSAQPTARTARITNPIVRSIRFSVAMPVKFCRRLPERFREGRRAGSRAVESAHDMVAAVDIDRVAGDQLGGLGRQSRDRKPDILDGD